MKLYSYYRSSSAWRVRIVLEWKGLAYEYAAVNLSPDVREQHADAFDTVNPQRQVPTLEWTENGKLVRLTQSVAIAEFLEERHPTPPLLPVDTLARARVRQLVEVITSGIQPHQNTGTLAAVGRFTSAENVREWARSAIARGLSALEVFARMYAGEHFAGDEVTLADAYLVPQMYNARRFEVDLSHYPKLIELDARASALPAFARAHPDRQIDAPPSPRP